MGPEEKPFGIQKDFLCAKSAYYRQYFSENNRADSIEHIVKLPTTPVQVFAITQNYLFTGQVFPKPDDIPSYEVLIGVWKLAHDLGIDGLCDTVLEAMTECRRITQRIPATPLLVQVWQDTPEGSSIRRLLLGWAAEYMRSSDSRAEFAKSLPQEVLSELVVAMSSLDSTPVVQVNGGPSSPSQEQGGDGESQNRQQSQPRQGNTHPLEDDDDSNGRAHPSKKPRHSDVLPNRPATSAGKAGRKPSRSSLPSSKPPAKRWSTASHATDRKFTTAQKLNFCSDLLTRMLSGPGRGILHRAHPLDKLYSPVY